MSSVDIHNNMDSLNALTAVDITTDTTTVGVIIDTDGAEGLEWLIKSETVTDGTFTPKLEDGNDAGLSDAADIPTDFLVGTIAAATFVAADDNTVKQIGAVNHKRFVRLSLVSTGTSSGGNFSSTAVKSPKNQKAIS